MDARGGIVINAYRIALILCRAAIIALCLSAALRLIIELAVVLVARAGGFGTGLPGAFTSLLLPLGQFVFTLVIAIFLEIFTPTLCASATGKAILEGEPLSKRRRLEPQEQVLAWTGAGFILLFFFTSGSFLSIIYLFYEFSANAAFQTAGIGRSVMMQNLIKTGISVAIYCLTGFILAFRLGLQRLIKPAE